MADTNALHPGYDGALIPLWGRVARTEDPGAVVVHNLKGSTHLVLVFRIWAKTGSPSVTVYVQGIDPTNLETWDILESVALTNVGTIVLRVSPHLDGAANTVAKDIVPAYLRFDVAHANSDSITYEATVQLVG